jgi:hypothetical protein
MGAGDRTSFKTQQKQLGGGSLEVKTSVIPAPQAVEMPTLPEPKPATKKGN